MSTPATIVKLNARQVLDSRGNPTVEAEVFCQSGAFGRAIVPSGASTGKHEALELRDGDSQRYGGKGVCRAVQHVLDDIAPRIHGMSVLDQPRIDRTMIELDGTPNKGRLGANALLAVSLACAHAGAAVRGLPLWRHLDTEERACLPLPMVNMISGGLHAGQQLDVQDFLLVPIGARSYSEALEMTVAVYRALAQVLSHRGCEAVLVGDEGGFGPRLEKNEHAIQVLVEAIEKAGLRPGQDAGIALDIASTHFYDPSNDTYSLVDLGGLIPAAELVDLLVSWVDRYPILSIEDGMAEDDWSGWHLLTSRLKQRVQLIGDDLFVTNPQRLQRGIDQGVGNAILVKMNQIGTLTETFQVLDLARNAGYRAVVSARSGETEDTTLADLAVASGAGQIKIGSIARSERLAKYNQLLRIEEQLGAARFRCWQPRA